MRLFLAEQLRGGETMKNQKGFTLIELLVVLAIIALLSTLSVVALGSARLKARDAKRLSDIKQIQTALELYFTDQNAYPTNNNLTLGGAGARALSSGGFSDTGSGTIYMGSVPANPAPGGASYIYTGSASTYTISFSLEGLTSGLAAGPHTATPNGIQ